MPDVLAMQVYLRGLSDKSPDLRKASAGALVRIRDQAVPVLEQLARQKELSSTVIPELQKVFTSMQPLTTWRVLGPFEIKAPAPLAPRDPIDLEDKYVGIANQTVTWKLVQATDEQGEINLGQIYSNLTEVAAYGYAEVQSPVAGDAQMAVGSDDTLTVWVNGRQVYNFQESRSLAAEAARFDIKLAKGSNRIWIMCGNHGGPWQFIVALAVPGDYAFLKAPAGGGFNPEAFRTFALVSKGDPEHGRVLFHDLKGLACIKCHTVDKAGGDRRSRAVEHRAPSIPREVLITSVLNPSAQISSGYEPVIVALADGRILTGIVKSDTADGLEIEDADAKRLRIPKDEIEERKRSDVSIMPNGLAEGLKPQDFADLIAYLETLKDVSAKPNASSSGR